MEKTNNIEDVHAQEHEEFMQQVHESGLPMWMLDYYGSNFQPLNEKNHPESSALDTDADLNI